MLFPLRFSDSELHDMRSAVGSILMAIEVLQLAAQQGDKIYLEILRRNAEIIKRTLLSPEAACSANAL